MTKKLNIITLEREAAAVAQEAQDYRTREAAAQDYLNKLAYDCKPEVRESARRVYTFWKAKRESAESEFNKLCAKTMRRIESELAKMQEAEKEAAAAKVAAQDETRLIRVKRNAAARLAQDETPPVQRNAAAVQAAAAAQEADRKMLLEQLENGTINLQLAQEAAAALQKAKRLNAAQEAAAVRLPKQDKRKRNDIAAAARKLKAAAQ